MFFLKVLVSVIDKLLYITIGHQGLPRRVIYFVRRQKNHALLLRESY